MMLAEFAQAQLVEKMLIARTTSTQEMWDQKELRVFGFAETLMQDGLAPGPVLEFVEGDSVKLDLWNVSQGAPHTIHLHGLDVDQANDGVPHLSFDVAHMDHGYYYFVAPHPGTYLYHCHVVSSIHVQAGMYGLLIVRPSTPNMTWDGGYAFHQEKSWLLSEMDSVWHNDTVLNHDHDSMTHHVPIPDYRPQYFLVNGLSEQQLDTVEYLTAAKEEVVFCRFANVGYYGNRIVFPSELNAQIISSDGRPFPTPELSDTLWMTPGERYGVLLKSAVDLVSNIAIDYFDLNTQQVENTQLLEVTINGVLSLEEEVAAEVNYFPNPSRGTIQLNVGGDLQVHDALGKVVWEQSVKAGELVKLSLDPATYTLQLNGVGIGQLLLLK
jgi:FtsP/CotA-like multicopper oxidase with cupredoxin domain